MILGGWGYGKQLQAKNVAGLLQYPVEFLLEITKLCMYENLFYFGHLLSRQKNGAAVGTKMAVGLANLYAGHPEKQIVNINYINPVSYTHLTLPTICSV